MWNTEEMCTDKKSEFSYCESICHHKVYRNKTLLMPLRITVAFILLQSDKNPGLQNIFSYVFLFLNYYTWNHVVHFLAPCFFPLKCLFILKYTMFLSLFVFISLLVMYIYGMNISECIHPFYCWLKLNGLQFLTIR